MNNILCGTPMGSRSSFFSSFVEEPLKLLKTSVKLSALQNIICSCDITFATNMASIHYLTQFFFPFSNVCYYLHRTYDLNLCVFFSELVLKIFLPGLWFPSFSSFTDFQTHLKKTKNKKHTNINKNT